MKGERRRLVVVIDSIGGARLQSVTSRRHDLSQTVNSSNKRISMAEPGVWRDKRMDLFFLWPALVFRPLRNKAQFKADGTRMLPMSLIRPIPGSAMLRKVLDQASAETR